MSIKYHGYNNFWENKFYFTFPASRKDFNEDIYIHNIDKNISCESILL